MPQSDNHDPLASLDFDAPDQPGGVQRDALDFSAGDEHGDVESANDVLDDYASAEPDDTGTELDAMDSQISATDDESAEGENGLQIFTVANPADTVSVSALIDGRTQRVELSEMMTKMTESELSAELLTLAELARQKGLSGQRTYLLENPAAVEAFRELGEAIGMDGGELLEGFTEFDMGLPTSEQAEAAQAEVFASMYGDT
ncbi:MAG: hypothetical protein WCI78_04725 [Mycobacterium sp.]